MHWIGSLIGSYLGGLIGRLPGAIIGAVIGYQAEKAFRQSMKEERRRSSLFGAQSAANVFCASAAAMLAKMAKADGRISENEIAGIENAFLRLGFSPEARRYAVQVFRRAKDDRQTIYDYAYAFASCVRSVEVRELFYEILWDVACADGHVGPNELLILQRIPRALGIRTDWYAYFASQRLRGRADGRQDAPRRDPLADAYALLGASASDDADALKRKYRELAKRNHPDALRAQGLPEDMIGKATERMSRINEAWATVRNARGLS